MLSGRVRNKPYPSHQQQLRDCSCISTWEPRPCPEGSQRASQNPCSEDASKSNPSQSKKTLHALGSLTGGFVGRFCSDFLGLAGGFRGGRAPAVFLFSAGGFSGGFFRRIFFCILRHPPQKSTAKSTTSMAVFWQIFHRRLNPSPAVSKFQVQHWNPPWNRNQVCLPFFVPRLRNSWSMATTPLEIPRQAGFKPHSLTGQEIAHSKARRQAEIYTSKTRMAPPNSLQVWKEGD